MFSLGSLYRLIHSQKKKKMAVGRGKCYCVFDLVLYCHSFGLYYSLGHSSVFSSLRDSFLYKMGENKRTSKLFIPLDKESENANDDMLADIVACIT